MNDLVILRERPAAETVTMIAGWRQWADAGTISSGLPQYLIKQTGAKKIGEIAPYGFYLFQIPGTHHFLRPQIKLVDGHRKSLETKENEFYYWDNGKKGLVIFLGDEPHLNAEQYVDAFLYAVKEMGVSRVAAVGGVYGSVPYDRDREISCVYSLRKMRNELADYAFRFSNYEGGTTIGTYLVDRAEKQGVEFLTCYGFVPAYDFSEQQAGQQVMQIERDYKAWYDLMRRFNHMFGLDIDLTDLEQRSYKLLASLDAKIDDWDERMPQFKIRDYLETLAEEFSERPFMPLGDLWEGALREILDDLDE